MKLLDQSAKTNWKFIAIIAFVAVFLAGGILLLIPQFQEQPPPPAPSPQSPDTSGFTLSEVEGWQTYRSDEFGFEVKYPEGWEIKESLTEWVIRGVRDIGFVDDIDSKTGFAVQQYSNHKNLSFNEWWDESTLVCDEQGMNCRPTVKRAAEQVNIDGLPGYKVSAEFPYFEIFTSNHQKLYILYGYAASGSKLETINQILSTFRFVE